MRGGHTDGNALLQQQLGCLDDWVCVKALLHAVVVEDVAERDQAHTLVMGHERADQDTALALR